MRAAALALAALALAGCRGEEVARVALAGPGQTGTASFTTTAPGELQVCVDYDGSWTGTRKDPGLRHAIEVRQGEATIQTLDCATSTCDEWTCGATSHRGTLHTARCECKTSCLVRLEKAGTFTVKATSSSEGDFRGTNASLVLRR